MQQYVRTRTPPRRQARTKQAARFTIEHAFLAILIGVAAFGIVAGGISLGFQVWYAGRIFPGVQVAGIPVGGKTMADASQLINASLTYPQSGRIVLQDGSQNWLTSPAQLGLFLDADTSVKSAFAVGRSGSIFKRLGVQRTAWLNSFNLPPVLILDERLAYQYLANLASQIDSPMVEPGIQINGTEVTVTTGQAGRQLDIPASLALLENQLRSLQDGIIPLAIQQTNPVIVNAAEQAELARRILSAPLTLTLPEGQQDEIGPWVFSQHDLASMLAFEVVQSGGTSLYQATLRSGALRDLLVELQPQLLLNPQNTRFTFNDDTHLLEVIRPAVIGRALDVETSIRAVQDKLVSGEHTVPLVFNFTPPSVTDEMTGEQLGVAELVRSYVSYFYGSPPERVQNIQAASRQFHGLLIAPGETFSMATALGDISLDNGYAEALIIVGSQTVKGVGGGVCQVSTTLFRTAFFAGFPIVERHEHAYRVGYYEKTAGNERDPSLAGMDATVYAPLVDLKFTNDTPYWLLMETYVSPTNSTITWKFYSTSDGRTVEWHTTGPVNVIEAPKTLYRENPDLPTGEVKQVDYSADGADITVDRIVSRGGSVYFQDTFYTQYQPWQAIYEYGPGTEGMPPPEE